MKIIDISREITEYMPVYKNKADKKPRICTATINEVTESRICLDSHTGTHLDSPSHMIPSGKTVSDISPEKMISDCIVLDLTKNEERINEADLRKHDKLIRKGIYILLKTKNSLDEIFNPGFVYLDESGARYLADKQVAGVGIDALGIERGQDGHPTHKTLMNANIIIVEGLNLENAKAGSYKLFIAPLKIRIDASPARALLIEGEIK